MPGMTNAIATTITVWEDDPASGTLTTVPLPDVARQPFGYLFDRPAPPLSNQTHTADFRYWNAAEALRRGADFWAPAVPGTNKRWQRGPVLEVYLDRWEDLQADYDRTSLNFYFRTLPGDIVYTGASPDTLCHELGHAILDAIKPELWDAGILEVAAFHESFGDMSAILSALQLPSLRASVLAETQGQLYRSSRLSRLAEQFGIRLHIEDAHGADADCLRNAWNDFNYRDPFSLASEELTILLSSNPHSFSRIFTGALFEALCLFLDHHAANSTNPTPDELLEVSELMRDIVARGVIRSSVVTSYFAEVAQWMVDESALIDPDPQYSAILLDTFVRRSILSAETAVAIQSLQTEPGTGEDTTAGSQPQLVDVSVPVSQFGLSEPLLVGTAARMPRLMTRSGTADGKSLEPVNPETAATTFVAELFANGEVDPQGYVIRGGKNVRKPESRTHMLVREEKGLVLRRRLFHCGPCGGDCNVAQPRMAF